MKYRKKPVVIDAVQFTGTKENYAEISRFCPSAGILPLGNAKGPGENCLLIKTLEGNHIANYGDWIIKGVKGEFYPCKPDIFELTYEAHIE